MSDDSVEHSGIKGMKWGVRRSRKELARLRQGPSADAKEAHKALVKSKISGVESLSNKELNALNNRLNLEQNYARLSYQPSKLKKGLDTVGGLLKAGNTVNDAVKFAESPVGKKMAESLSGKAKKNAATKAAKAATSSSFLKLIG